MRGGRITVGVLSHRTRCVYIGRYMCTIYIYIYIYEKSDEGYENQRFDHFEIIIIIIIRRIANGRSRPRVTLVNVKDLEGTRYAFSKCNSDVCCSC